MLRLIAVLALATPALAEDFVWTEFDGSFEDATFAVEQAIIGQGLVVEYVSHVSEMLARTARDVGAEGSPVDGGAVFLTCSATVSREVIEADAENIRFCPYTITVLDSGGRVRIGRHDYPPASMDPAEAMLDKIIAAASW